MADSVTINHGDVCKPQFRSRFIFWLPCPLTICADGKTFSHNGMPDPSYLDSSRASRKAGSRVIVAVKVSLGYQYAVHISPSPWVLSMFWAFAFVAAVETAASSLGIWRPYLRTHAADKTCFSDNSVDLNTIRASRIGIQIDLGRE